MKSAVAPPIDDDFIAPAQRAFASVAKQLRLQGIPVTEPKIKPARTRKASRPKKTPKAEKPLANNMKEGSPKPKKSAGLPLFVIRAERAMARAARNVIAQNRTLKLLLIVWQDGKVVEKRA